MIMENDFPQDFVTNHEFQTRYGGQQKQIQELRDLVDRCVTAVERNVTDVQNLKSYNKVETKWMFELCRDLDREFILPHGLEGKAYEDIFRALVSDWHRMRQEAQDRALGIKEVKVGNHGTIRIIRPPELPSEFTIIVQK